VNDIDLLTGRLEADPSNSILASMLTDELMESRGMIRSEADRHVASVVAVAGQARQLAEATHLMRSGSASGRWLHTRCRRWAHIAQRIPYTLLLVAGDAPPVIASAPLLGELVPWTGVLITVGAAWAIHEWQVQAAQKRTRRRYVALKRPAARQVSNGSAHVE
jgi:hypothetical protein